jgi:signal transduction histidine kinase
MADASHELRTPVSIARTAAQVTLGGGARSEAEYRESLAIIADQMKRVTRVVDDMFLLALADLDARPLDRRDFYLNEVVTDCVRAANVLATARQVAIAADVGTADIAATGDEGLVREMVMTLLDNAIRHTPSQGQVTVTVAEDDGAVELAIEDSGPGIPVASQERVFDRFVRLDARGPGAGLGLSIAKWIADQHGWQLRVDGRGQTSSRFVLTMPDAATVSPS